MADARRDRHALPPGDETRSQRDATADGDRSLSTDIDSIRRRFQAALTSGQQPRAEHFVAGLTEPTHSQLLAELLRLELECARTLAAPGSAGDNERHLPGPPSLPASRNEADIPTYDVSSGNGLSPGGPRARTHRSRYRIVRMHAQGGLGQVSVAIDCELDRQVALKELKPKYIDDGAWQARFIREARITGRLEHPGIVPIYGLDYDSQGAPYYAMRFIEGESMMAAIRRYHESKRTSKPGGKVEEVGPAVEFRQLLRWFVNVCNAVAYAHSRDVLHRDIKPSNVMLGKFGETFLVDWGLARAADESDQPGGSTRSPDDETHTQLGDVLGTPAYMAPEQAAGAIDRLGPACDIYSLGATLYTILTGQLAFSGSALEVIEKVQRGHFAAPRKADPSIPKPLEAICLKAMALDPAQRYGDALQLATDIERWLADEPVTAYRDPWTVRAGRWARRHRVLVNTLVSGLIVAVVALSVATALVDQAHNRAEFRFSQARKAVDDNLLNIVDEPQLQLAQFRPLRRKLLERGLQYYSNFLEEKHADADLRAVRAGARLRSATIHQDMGSGSEALEDYQIAFASFQELGADQPLAPEWRLDLARGYKKYGDLLASDPESRARAPDVYQQALQITGALAEIPETRFEATRLEAGLHNSLGSWYKNEQASEAEMHGRKASELYATLLEEDPADDAARRGLADSFVSLATLLQETRQLDEAETAYKNARAQWQVLQEPGQAGLEARAAEGRILHDLGVLYQLRGNSEDAATVREEALEVRRTVAYTHGLEHFINLARTCNDFGSQRCQQGDLQEGLKLMAEARHLREQIVRVTGDSLRERVQLSESLHSEASLLIDHRAALPEDPLLQAEQLLNEAQQLWSVSSNADREAVEDVMHRAWNYHLRGYLQLARQEFDSADQSFETAHELRAQLVANEPNHPQRLQDLVATKLMLGNVALHQGRREETLARFESAVSSAEQLAELRAGDFGAQQLYGVVVYSLANAQFRLNVEPEAAVANLRRAVDRLEPLLPKSRDMLGQAYRLLWQIELRRQDVERAAAAARAAQALWPQDAGKQIEAAQQFSLCLRSYATEDPEAKAAHDALAAEAIKALRVAVELGFRNRAVLDSENFAPLKSYREFQDLLLVLD